MFEIEKNVPLPKARNKYPLSSMEVGDSFLVPKKLRATVSSAITAARERNGSKFTTRIIGKDSVRIWRVK